MFIYFFMLSMMAGGDWINQQAGLPAKGLDKIEKYLEKRNKVIDAKIRKLKGKKKPGPGIIPISNDGINVNGAVRPDLIRVEGVMMVFGTEYHRNGPEKLTELSKLGMPAGDLAALNQKLTGAENEPTVRHEKEFRARVAKSRYGYLVDADEAALKKAPIMHRTNYQHLAARTHIAVRRDWTAEVLGSLSLKGREVLLNHMFAAYGDTRVVYR